MIITREFLDKVATNLKCCLASVTLKYQKKLKYGLDPACLEIDSLLLGRYLEIICSYEIGEKVCECSLLGSWTATSDFFGGGTVYFYEGGIGRWYINSTTYATFFYTVTDTYVELAFYDEDGLTNLFVLYATGESLFSEDCTTFSAYNELVSPGTTAFAIMVDLNDKYANPTVTLNGVTIYTQTNPLDTSSPDFGITNGWSMQDFANGFNASNTLGMYMDTQGELQGFVIYAPATGASYNGQEFIIGDQYGRFAPILTLNGGVDPSNADLNLSLIAKDAKANCCTNTNCVTEAQLKDIINHVSKLCSLYKCC